MAEAFYSLKSDTALDWEDVRQHLTLQIDGKLRALRRRVLNRVLGDAHAKFVHALKSDESLVLDDAQVRWVDDVLRAHGITAEALMPPIDAEPVDDSDVE